MAKATFGAGCFWHVEAAFREIPGVTATAVGFEGGITANPSYEEVCSRDTGHAEVVQVEFDPAQVSYGRLLATFWNEHDPTQFHRQGPDIGSQYRSIILFHDEEQRDLALATRDAVQAKTSKPVTTEIVPAADFYIAEDYHQQYFEKQGISSCAVTVMNKPA
jgi:peptide-methionine (S)-S-oxide reductase